MPSQAFLREPTFGATQGEQHHFQALPSLSENKNEILKLEKILGWLTDCYVFSAKLLSIRAPSPRVVEDKTQREKVKESTKIWNGLSGPGINANVTLK